MTMAADGAGAVIEGAAGGVIGGSEGAQAGAAVGGMELLLSPKPSRKRSNR